MPCNPLKMGLISAARKNGSTFLLAGRIWHSYILHALTGLSGSLRGYGEATGLFEMGGALIGHQY